jgi:hypothetical protein
MKPIHPSPKQGEETSPQGLAGILGQSVRVWTS